jgi:hypothetical protein
MNNFIKAVESAVFIAGIAIAVDELYKQEKNEVFKQQTITGVDYYKRLIEDLGGIIWGARDVQSRIKADIGNKSIAMTKEDKEASKERIEKIEKLLPPFLGWKEFLKQQLARVTEHPERYYKDELMKPTWWILDLDDKIEDIWQEHVVTMAKYRGRR